MTRTSLRNASEAGLISQILLRLSSDAKRARADSARSRRPTSASGRVGESAGERTREALRELDLNRRTPARGQ